MTEADCPRLTGDPASGSPHILPSFHLLGLRLHALTKGDIVSVVRRAIEARRRCVFGNHNLHSLYLWKTEPRFRLFYSLADYVHIDGMSIVVLGRLFGLAFRPRHRTNYIDLVPLLAREAVKREWRIFYLGSRGDVAQRAAGSLQQQHPGLKIATRDGYFDTASAGPANQAVLAAIRAYAPDILMVGMGMPRQETWIEENLNDIEANVIFCCGGLMDAVAGAIPTPPRWIGPLGLEWLFRLCSQPSRTGRRYLIEPWSVLLWIAKRGLRGETLPGTMEAKAQPPSGIPGSAVPFSLRRVTKRGARVLLTTANRASGSLRGSSPRGVRILTYHDVGPAPADEWCVSTARFAEQMRYLADHHRLVSLDQIRAWLAGEGSLPEDALALTFDDGLRGVYEHALPLLDRYGIPSTCFIVDAFARRGSTWEGKPAVSAAQIQAMAAAGMLIGAHGRTHVSLGSSELSHDQLLAEALVPRQTLEQILSRPVRYFAYPYGTRNDVSARAIATLQKAGYDLALTSIHGPVLPAADPFLLSRIKVERADSLATFRSLLSGGMDCWSWIDNNAGWLQSPRRTRVLSE